MRSRDKEGHFYVIEVEMNRAEPLGKNLILYSRLKSKCLHILRIFYFIQIFRLKIQTKGKIIETFFKNYTFIAEFSISLSLRLS